MGWLSGRAARAAGVVLLAAGLAVQAGIANAVGEGPPVVTAPTPDSQVPQGYTGPLTADLSGAPYGTYHAEVTCSDPDAPYYSASETFAYFDESESQLAWTFPPIVGPYDFCRAHVTHSEKSWLSDVNVFYVEPAPVAFTELAVTPESFYPLVRDGYRDAVTVTFRVNQSLWDTTMSVRDSSGATVRTDELGYVRAVGLYPETWTWDGTTDAGGVAAPGAYTLQLTGTAVATGITGTTTTDQVITLATGWTTKRVTRSRPGNRGVGATQGNCRITRDTSAGVAHLACRGGRYASMTYTFRLPADATAIRWGVLGDLSSADSCCDGVVRRRGWLDGNLAKVRVKVSRSRAYRVQRVGVAFTTRVRL